MPTANDVIKVAKLWIGTKEYPPNSNNVRFNTDYYGKEVSGSYYPWCCVFVWDIFRLAKASNLFYDGKRVAYCPYVESWGIKNKLTVPRISGDYGDIVLFDWNHDGEADHIGFIESRNKDGSYTTIEGNTAYGNDSNGGEVMRRNRTPETICCIIRPKYDKGEETMSYEQWKEYNEQYKKEEAKKGVPQDKNKWEYKAWEFVTMAGISDGYRPFATVTRVELWGMLRLFYKLMVKTFGGKK